MCLRFTFLLITRVTAWLRLSRREQAWRTAEILILRHQLAVLQRRQPRRPNVNWADRALLAALLGVIPKARRQGLRLLVTPDTIMRWHRDIIWRGTVALRHACARSRHDHPDGRWSDGEREVVEGDAEPVAAGDVGGDVVMAAAQILHEGVTGGEGPR